MSEDSNFFSKKLSEKEIELYDRQFRLEGWSQEIVKNSTALIAGVGGLGCEIAKNLAMVGVGKLILVDLDIIEFSNLNRQLLFVDAEIGEPKAIAAAKKLRQINPYITIEAYNSSLERLNPYLYKEADIIIGGLDSMNARLNLNAQAVRFKKPLVDGGVSGYHGHIYAIFPFENGCYECNPLPVVENDDMAACTVVGIPRKRVHCLFKANLLYQEKFDIEPNIKNLEVIEFIEKEANSLVNQYNFQPEYSKSEIIKILDRHDPGIITINSIISALQSHEAIKILHWLKNNDALGIPIKSYIVFNAMTMKFYQIEKKRNIDCIQCSENVKREDIYVNLNDSCQKIIDKLKEKGYKLNTDMEPIITTLDFNDINMIDTDKTVLDNNLRNLELIIVAGFEEGEILVNLNLN
ncbi:MAG: ThiF family adenylyltransferase [Candidatus Lokiarchaeota archaeon]|nr:ThiF family adenylyltransferase [Candidatus Lokiarchaeota archaeon]